MPSLWLLTAQAQRQMGRRRGVEGHALAVASYLDAQLAAVGQADPRFSLLRPCSIAVLRLGTGRAPAAQQQGASGSGTGANGNGSRRLFPSVRSIVQQGRTQQARLQALQEAAAAAEVRIMGGTVSSALGPHITHVVGAALPHLVPPAAAAAAAAEQRPPAPAVEPEALLRAVVEQAGGAPAVSALKLGLATGNMRLVSDRWAGLAARVGHPGKPACTGRQAGITTAACVAPSKG